MTSSRATPPGAAAPPPARPAATVPAEEPPASAALFLGPLLDLSHDLAWARTEPEVCAAVASALEGLFPGRRHAVRLLDPRTLALTAIRAKGPLRQPDLPALVLGRDTARQAGLSPEALQAAGVTIAAADAPLFEGSGTVTVAPLAVAGALHGLVNLEYEPDGDQVPAADEVMLRQLANLAALGARNLRSMEELASLKTYLEDLIEHANALIAVVGRDRRVTVWNGGLTRLTGVPRGEARGRELTDFAVADERAALAALLAGFAGVSLDRPDASLAQGLLGAGFCPDCQREFGRRLSREYGDQFQPLDYLKLAREAVASAPGALGFSALPFGRDFWRFRHESLERAVASHARAATDAARAAGRPFSVSAWFEAVGPAQLAAARHLDAAVFPTGDAATQGLGLFALLRAAMGRRPVAVTAPSGTPPAQLLRLASLGAPKVSTPPPFSSRRDSARASWPPRPAASASTITALGGASESRKTTGACTWWAASASAASSTARRWRPPLHRSASAE